jgi:opacity protein-like surface antigen
MINHIWKTTGAMIISAFCCLAQNNGSIVDITEHGVKFGAGVITRHFEDTKIKGASGGTIVKTKPLGAMTETITVVSGGTSGKMDVESIDCFGPVISLEFGVWQKEAITLSVIGDFQYYCLDNSRRINGSTTETHSYTPVGEHSSFGSVIGDIYTFGDSFKAKVDMDLYILDLGLKADYAFSESFELFASFGPSVAFVDTESKVNDRHDSDEDFIFGLYANVGMAYWFSEKIGISCEIRYDTAFEKVETKDIKQELDGFGGALKLLIAF